MNEDKRNPVQTKSNRWIGYLGGVFLFICVAIGILMLLGPIIGNTFSTINGSLTEVGDEYLYSDGGSGFNAIKPALVTQRLIIRNGILTITVKDTLSAQEEIEQLVDELAEEGAFVVSSNTRGGNDDASPVINMEIRIPAESFDETMDQLAGMAVDVDERSETAEDVTAEYVDLKARIEALEAARDRLIEIMKESATTDALLRAEQQLTQREGELESLKGQMQYLAESARLSKITIHLNPYILNQPLNTSWRPSETVRQASESFVKSLQVFADLMIIFAITVLPWLLFIGVIWYGVARVFKSRQAKKRTDIPKG